MAKIYFVRHQAHGIVADFPFYEHPSAEQVAAVAKWCFNIHGFGHLKTPKEPYWTRVVSFDLLGVNDVPQVPDRSLTVMGDAASARSAASPFVAEGTGHVTGGKK